MNPGKNPSYLVAGDLGVHLSGGVAESVPARQSGGPAVLFNSVPFYGPDGGASRDVPQGQFPYLAQLYGYPGGAVDLPAFPPAFLESTGRHHWEVLLRAMAPGAQAFAIAPNQASTADGETAFYGNSMVRHVGAVRGITKNLLK